MKRNKILISIIIVFTTLSVVYMFFDYHILLNGNSWLTMLIIRWTTYLIITLSFLFLSLNIKKKLLTIIIKLLMVIIISASFFYLEDSRPLRAYSLNSFLNKHNNTYNSVIRLTNNNKNIHQIDLNTGHPITFKDRGLNIISMTADEKKIIYGISSDLLQIGISRVVIEENCIMFLHSGRTNSTCGLIYYGNNKYHEFKNYSETWHIQLNNKWSYYGSIIDKGAFKW